MDYSTEKAGIKTFKKFIKTYARVEKLSFATTEPKYRCLKFNDL